MSLKTVKLKPEVPAYMEHDIQTVWLHSRRITKIVSFKIIVAESPESGYGEPDVCPSDEGPDAALGLRLPRVEGD